MEPGIGNYETGRVVTGGLFVFLIMYQRDFSFPENIKAPLSFRLCCRVRKGADDDLFIPFLSKRPQVWAQIHGDIKFTPMISMKSQSFLTGILRVKKPGNGQNRGICSAASLLSRRA